MERLSVRQVRKQMDKILITSHMFRDYFVDEFGINNIKIKYLPQYAEEIFQKIPPKKENHQNTIHLVPI